ncbi:hypothetical protein E2562_035202 [Oryza meyeriana var. granulata]|uniref:Uncharacterized protein n=1 Tax=Oryza meyeriana var. granulata TaxID=110450 RepID=A0A6G1D9D0_9ORYZ|nr:hypothetical protein E2562_035202 [Oryza meyeriana var. granulata]
MSRCATAPNSGGGEELPCSSVICLYGLSPPTPLRDLAIPSPRVPNLYPFGAFESRLPQILGSRGGMAPAALTGEDGDEVPSHVCHFNGQMVIKEGGEG